MRDAWMCLVRVLVWLMQEGRNQTRLVALPDELQMRRADQSEGSQASVVTRHSSLVTRRRTRGQEMTTPGIVAPLAARCRHASIPLTSPFTQSKVGFEKVDLMKFCVRWCDRASVARGEARNGETQSVFREEVFRFSFVLEEELALLLALAAAADFGDGLSSSFDPMLLLLLLLLRGEGRWRRVKNASSFSLPVSSSSDDGGGMVLVLLLSSSIL